MLDFSHDPHKRYNPLSGEWVKVSPHRTKRPWQGKTEAALTDRGPAHDPSCYLCPGNQRSGGQENPEYQEGTFVFDNDFAALLPDSSPEVWDGGELFRAKGVRGRCRVMCFSPRHDLTLAMMSIADIEVVIRTWTQEYVTLGGDPLIRHVQIFENRGEVMGCSNPHPHCQIWAEDDIPDLPARELEHQAEWMKHHAEPMLVAYAREELSRGERVVLENRSFVAVVPFWAVWPFETLVLPRRAMGSLSQLSPMEVSDLAVIIKALTTRYDNLFQTSFPYSMGIHQLPTDGGDWPGAQLHIHFYPPLLRSATVKKFMVGYEMLAGPQRDISAEQAAARLRDLPSTHYLDTTQGGAS